MRRKLSKFKTEGAYNHHLVALTVFFNWCRKRRYITDNPTLGLSTHRRPTRARILTDNELKLIWNACENGCRPEKAKKNTDQGLVLPRSFCKIVQPPTLTASSREGAMDSPAVTFKYAIGAFWSALCQRFGNCVDQRV